MKKQRKKRRSFGDMGDVIEITKTGFKTSTALSIEVHEKFNCEDCDEMAKTLFMTMATLMNNP